jgi:hypothetical protein
MAVVSTLAACHSATTTAEDVESADQDLITDATSLTACAPDGRDPQCPAGSFVATCRDSSREVVTAAKIAQGDVCSAKKAVDPFDPASCAGPKLTAATISSMRSPGAESTGPLGKGSVAYRSRHCAQQPTAANAGNVGCTAWEVRAPVPETGALGAGVGFVAFAQSHSDAVTGKWQPVKSSGGSAEFRSMYTNAVWASALLSFETVYDHDTGPHFIACASKDGGDFTCDVNGMAVHPSRPRFDDYAGHDRAVTMTASCARVVVYGSSRVNEHSVGWAEGEAVFLWTW